MPPHFHLPQIKESINSLTTAVTALKASQDQYHESFLRTIEILKIKLQALHNPPVNPPLTSQILHPHFPPLPVTRPAIPDEHDLATLDRFSAPETDKRSPIVPFTLVTGSTIPISEKDIISAVETHQNLPAIPQMLSQFSEGGEKSVMLTDVEVETEKREELVMREQEGDEFISAMELWLSSTPAKPPPLYPPPNSSTTRFLISHIPIKLPPPEPPDWGPSASPAAASFPAMEQSSGTSFCWPWVPWSLHSQNMLRVPSSLFPSAACPSSSVQSSASATAVSFVGGDLLPGRAPSPGATSCWPWVPWSIGTQTKFRVSIGMCELGFITALGPVVGWFWLLKGKWVDRQLLVCLHTNLGLVKGWALFFMFNLLIIMTLYGWYLPMMKYHMKLKIFTILRTRLVLMGYGMIGYGAEVEYSRCLTSYIALCMH